MKILVVKKPSNYMGVESTEYTQHLRQSAVNISSVIITFSPSILTIKSTYHQGKISSLGNEQTYYSHNSQKVY